MEGIIWLSLALIVALATVLCCPKLILQGTADKNVPIAQG